MFLRKLPYDYEYGMRMMNHVKIFLFEHLLKTCEVSKKIKQVQMSKGGNFLHVPPSSGEVMTGFYITS